MPGLRFFQGGAWTGLRPGGLPLFGMWGGVAGRHTMTAAGTPAGHDNAGPLAPEESADSLRTDTAGGDAVPRSDALSEGPNFLGHEESAPPTPAYPACGAGKRQGEGTCTKPAGWGTDHVGVGPCKLHGGSTRNHRKGAARTLVTNQARALLDRLGEPEPVQHPVIELLDLAARLRHWERITEELLTDADELATLDSFGVERQRAVVEMFTSAKRDLGKLLVDLARLGLEERAQRITESQHALAVAALMATLAHPSIGLPADQLPAARALLAAELRKAGA